MISLRMLLHCSTICSAPLLQVCTKQVEAQLSSMLWCRSQNQAWAGNTQEEKVLFTVAVHVHTYISLPPSTSICPLSIQHQGSLKKHLCFLCLALVRFDHHSNRGRQRLYVHSPMVWPHGRCICPWESTKAQRSPTKPKTTVAEVGKDL